jgi:hypothetical protein
MDVVDTVAGQLAVVRQAQHIEIHVAVRGIGMVLVDQPLYELDHLGDVSGGAGFGRRRQHTQRVIGRGERALERGSPLPPRPAGVGGLVEDLVVDVGDVADEGDVVAVGGQPATQHVEGDAAANVPDMGQALHRRTAQVDGGVPWAQRHEFTYGTSHGVVQP